MFGFPERTGGNFREKGKKLFLLLGTITQAQYLNSYKLIK